MANDTEIRSFVYPYNQTHGHTQLARISDSARIIGMDALFHHHKFVWATQFNPGGMFYKDLQDRSPDTTNSGVIVSPKNPFLHPAAIISVISVVKSYQSGFEASLFLK